MMLERVVLIGIGVLLVVTSVVEVLVYIIRRFKRGR